MAKGYGIRITNIEDGIIEWYNGPDWDEVAAEEFKRAEDQIESYMKSEAPWADRTGAAREGLYARSGNAGGIITMEIGHGVDYGFWLEVIQNGRFAIIGPTMEAHAQRLFYNAIRRIRYARKGRS